MSDTTDALTQVIEDFVRAETALNDLAAHQQALAGAAEQFLQAEMSMRTTTHEAVDALEQIRASLAEEITSTQSITGQAEELSKVLLEVAASVRSATEQLREIDPERFMGVLGELRRDLSDHTAEVREIRRSVADLERTTAVLGKDVPQIAVSADAGRAAAEANGTALIELRRDLSAHAGEISGTWSLLSASFDELSNSVTMVSKRLLVLTLLVSAAVVASVVGALIAL